MWVGVCLCVCVWGGVYVGVLMKSEWKSLGVGWGVLG